MQQDTHALFNWHVLVNDQGADPEDAYLFECQAEDHSHAYEQALDAYPESEVLGAVCCGPYTYPGQAHLQLH